MKLDKMIAVRTNKTIYRDGDTCVKVFNEEYSKADVLNEATPFSLVATTALWRSAGASKIPAPPCLS